MHIFFKRLPQNFKSFKWNLYRSYLGSSHGCHVGIANVRKYKDGVASKSIAFIPRFMKSANSSITFTGRRDTHNTDTWVL